MFYDYDYETLQDIKYFASNGLIKYGGSFNKALGEALAHADKTNSSKIIHFWYEDVMKAYHMYKEYVG